MKRLTVFLDIHQAGRLYMEQSFGQVAMLKIWRNLGDVLQITLIAESKTYGEDGSRAMIPSRWSLACPEWPTGDFDWHRCVEFFDTSL